MRSKHFFIGLASCVSVACAISTGCSSSSSDDSAAPPVDAGPDVTAMDAAPDVAKMDTGVVETGPEACAVDADLATLPVPDASIGDSGATAAECVSCVKVACPTLIATCQMSCECVTAFVDFEQCIGTGQALFGCATSTLGGAGIGETQLACALSCEDECGVGGGGPDGGDGAAADGDDGSTDAASE
jgi:hypothetical protein